MTDKARIKVAAAVAVLFLAAVSAAGVITHTPRPPAATATTAQTAASSRSGRPSQSDPAPLWSEQENE